MSPQWSLTMGWVFGTAACVLLRYSSAASYVAIGVLIFIGNVLTRGKS